MVKKSMNGDDMFAPAEQFAEMLEENADEVMTGSHTLINRDRSGGFLAIKSTHRFYTWLLLMF